MLSSTKLCLATALMISMITYGQAASQARCPSDKDSEGTSAKFVIGGGSIALPIGAFLLIRQGDSIGALRLTTLSHDMTVEPRSKEWIGSVGYESYYQTSNKSRTDFESASKQSGQMVWGRYKGVGFHYSWQPGNRIALVGPWQFRFSAQKWMGMSTFSKWNGIQDHGFEFAPTSACEINEIDISSPNLKWFRYDRNFNSKTFPLTGLPK